AAAASPPLETNPSAPGYDPRKLETVLTTPQLFALEPRDAAWAATLEEDLGPLMASDIATVERTARGVAFDCHTTICRLRARAPHEGQTPLYRFVGGVYRPRDRILRPAGADRYFVPRSR